ncbi:spermidine/putrescine transport system permease protein [Rhodoligotrophos appendicifer]|uniref:ABC transporter permease n=1 Tax=Rhodoligotrophos appendicifer TaxID=987056 RepID=UPI001184F25D|nr:ABC transporter permease [Rhodoligotrophos appendicifer]
MASPVLYSSAEAEVIAVQEAERSRSPVGPLEFHRRKWLWAIAGATLLFLYIPLLSLMVFSFNNSRRNIVWQGFTTDYYVRAWNNASLFEAFTNSLTIAIIATLVSTVIGSMVALMLWRFRFPLKPVYEGFMALPIVIPEICMGVAMMAFFSAISWPAGGPWPLNLSAIIIAHIAFCFPFVAIVVRSRLVGFNRELEEASKDLGASEWQTFRYVIIPFLKPGLVAGALLAFTLSLDDFVITFFTSGPNAITFPVKIYSMVRFSVTPEVNAASTILIVITVIATIFAVRLQSPAKTAA